MTAHIQVMAGAEPFSFKGDNRGVLVLHGFTGCPQSMRPLAQAFADARFTVELPRLPGHGTTVEDMVAYRWTDWADAADAAYRDLASRCSTVVVAGLSMGGSLTLWLAQRRPEIKGIVLINPAAEPDDFGAFVEGAKAIIAGGGDYLPAVAGDIADPDAKELGYDKSPAAGLISLVEALSDIKAGLANINMPALLLHSPQDHVIPSGSADLLRRVLERKVEYVSLDRSYHVATIDYDKEKINQLAVEFGVEVSGGRPRL